MRIWFADRKQMLREIFSSFQVNPIVSFFSFCCLLESELSVENILFLEDAIGMQRKKKRWGIYKYLENAIRLFYRYFFEGVTFCFHLFSLSIYHLFTRVPL